MKIKMKIHSLDKIKKALDVIQEAVELQSPIGGIINIPDCKFTEEGLDLDDINSALLGFLRKKKIENYEHFYGWMTHSGGINISSEIAPVNENDYGIYEIKLNEKEMIFFQQEPIPEIHYNSKTGIGFIGLKRFKFKDNQTEYKVFPELYKNINRKVLRKKLLDLIGFTESKELSNQYDSKGNKLIGKQSATYKINELVKKIRKRTGLNTNQLVNNNGNLILVGKKLKIPPK